MIRTLPGKLEDFCVPGRKDLPVERNVVPTTVYNAIEGFKMQSKIPTTKGCTHENPTTKRCTHSKFPRRIAQWRSLEHTLEYTLFWWDATVRHMLDHTPEWDNKFSNSEHYQQCRRPTKPSRKSVSSLLSPLAMAMLTTCASTQILRSIWCLRQPILISSMSCTSQSRTNEMHARVRRINVGSRDPASTFSR